MKEKSEFIRSLWIKVQIEAPPSVQRTLVPRLHETIEVARLLTRLYLPVYEMQGLGVGGPLTVTYVGWAFAKLLLKSALFTADPGGRRVGRIPFWQCAGLVHSSSSDIVIVEAAKHLIRRLPHQNAIILPKHVDHILDVQGNWQDVRSRFHRTVRRNELRLVRKYGYEYDLSRDRRDFEEFYRQMYLPTMKDRHRELSSPVSVGEAWQYFRHGWLFRVKRDGDWVSGVVCYPWQDVLMAAVSGVKNADERLIHEGATAATYYASVHWANQHGYKAVNFQGTEPRLSGGLFQHKRKWGTTVSVPPNVHKQIWIQVRRVTPAVSQFLKENPFVVVDEGGKLHGLIVVDDARGVSAETKEEWKKEYVTSGLSSLLVRSLHRFVGEAASGNDPDLQISLTLSSSAGSGR